MRKTLTFVAVFAFLFVTTSADASWWKRWQIGLDRDAKQELIDAGVAKYLGHFTPYAAEDIGQGWTRHRFDPNQGGLVQGPLCITGTEYSVFTKIRNPRKVLFFMQGGGACWDGFYNCNPVVDAPQQLPPPPPVGIWGDAFDTGTELIANPLADYSVVYLPYCDGSVFNGDNDVFDADYPAAVGAQLGLPPELFQPVRFHRGLRNLSAGMDLARDMFPHARKIVVGGSSAGGVGAARLAPFLARILFGNFRDLAVFNDAGPVATNLLDVPAILARANDWQFGQFFPASCTECDVTGQGTDLIQWRLRKDNTVRESFYSTDGDQTNRFFTSVPTQELYRALILAEHGVINAAHPFRYKRFIQSGSVTHTALQTDIYYLGTANGTPLYAWVDGFLKSPLERLIEFLLTGKLSAWQDTVEDFVPVAAP